MQKKSVHHNAVVIFSKRPEVETSKTRLKGHITDGQRMELCERLLERVVKRLRDVTGTDTFICFTPESAEEYYKKFNLPIFPQSVDPDLGVRLFESIKYPLALGYDKVVVVGTDIPSLTPEIITESFELLEYSEVVFGPSADGGYYLVGMKQALGEVFGDITWSSPTTLKQSLDRSADAGYLSGTLNVLEDIDTLEDLQTQGLIKDGVLDLSLLD